MTRLKAVMNEKVGLFRDKDELNECLETIQELREAYENVYITGPCLRFRQELVTPTPVRTSYPKCPRLSATKAAVRFSWKESSG